MNPRNETSVDQLYTTHVAIFEKILNKLNQTLQLNSFTGQFQVKSEKNSTGEERILTCEMNAIDSNAVPLLIALKSQQENGILKFKEVITRDPEQPLSLISTFTITHINSDFIKDLLIPTDSKINTAMQLHKAVDSTGEITIRYKNFDIRVKFLQPSQVNVNSTSIVVLSVKEYVSTPPHKVSLKKQLEKKEIPSSIVDIIVTDLESIPQLITNLNNFFDLNEQDSFILYSQSSSEEYPIDLRISFLLSDPRTERIRTKLSGLVAASTIVAEESKDDNYITFIIKCIKPNSLYYNSSKGIDSDPAHMSDKNIGTNNKKSSPRVSVTNVPATLHPANNNNASVKQNTSSPNAKRYLQF